jgi:hypothetical protein
VFIKKNIFDVGIMMQGERFGCLFLLEQLGANTHNILLIFIVEASIILLVLHVTFRGYW